MDQFSDSNVICPTSSRTFYNDGQVVIYNLPKALELAPQITSSRPSLVIWASLYYSNGISVRHQQMLEMQLIMQQQKETFVV